MTEIAALLVTEVQTSDVAVQKESLFDIHPSAWGESGVSTNRNLAMRLLGTRSENLFVE